ncbi:MAG: phytoene desaturase family protein, partial [Anaerolineae bacterium]
RLEKELLALSPVDAKESKALCTAIKRYAWFIRETGWNPFQLIAKGVGILRGIPLLKEYGAMNIAEYAARFHDPLIRYAITNFFVYPDFSCIAVFFFLAGMHIKASGYPQGSSLALAKTIEHAFLNLGGKIEYKQKVKRIVVEESRAVGIELDDGTVKTAAIVISAADGHATLFDMLEDKYTTPALHERYATQPIFPPFVQVSLGVNRDMSGTPHAVKVQTAAPFEIAGQMHHDLWYHHFAFDPTTAPQGKTALTVLYPSDLTWWQNLGYPSAAYKAEKQRILDTTIAQLEQVLPGVASQVEVSDVATPVTTFRYTNNWQAALSFMMTKENADSMVAKTEYTLPGLENFYMIGQWVKGLGVPMAASSGKEVIQILCKADGRKFRVK